MDLRDEHLKNKDRLDRKGHPTIKVTNIKASAGKGTGTIHIKGKKKKIKFKYSTSGKMFIAKFKLKLKDFSLKKLRYLGVGVKSHVQVTARIPISK